MAASRLPSIVAWPVIERVQAIGGHEVDDRGLVLEVAGKLDPAIVGLQFWRVRAGLEELAASSVQRGYAGIATASQVDGGQIKRQAQAGCCAGHW